jgi:hypothetical protein
MLKHGLTPCGTRSEERRVVRHSYFVVPIRTSCFVLRHSLFAILYVAFCPLYVAFWVPESNAAPGASLTPVLRVTFAPIPRPEAGRGPSTW